MLIGDLLQERAGTTPDRTAYSFTESDGRRTVVTYGALWHTVQGAAADLQAVARTGDRVLLLCDPSLTYVEMFLAAASAGLVVVPAYPASATRHADRVRNIALDCEPTLVIADHAAPSDLGDLGLGEGVVWLDTAAVSGSARRRSTEDPAGMVPPALDDGDLLFLQYTSGSTGSPKGVMVTHANLVSNAEAAARTFGFHPGSVMVSWLPPFHDMGLIGCILTPLVIGFPSHLMSPSTFLRRPGRWLEAISELRATDSTAPNFAYRLCAERVADVDLSALDLSSWTKAMNGAEPVSRDVLDQFARAYEPAGFRPTSYRPCYGMAEATLLISGGHREDEEPRSAAPSGPVGPEAAGAFVSCGTPEDSATVRIVDHVDGTPRRDGDEGEIWVSSPSVARGYWNKPTATSETFAATTSEGEGPFLRTGDLGFFDGGELFVTGRIKDVIIVNGRNLYPQDLEDQVRSSHAAFTGRAAAAFETDGRVVVTVESVPGRAATVEALRVAARSAAGELARTYEIGDPLVVVLRRGTLTTTSSGKIQRSAARSSWSDGLPTGRIVTRSDEAVAATGTRATEPVEDVAPAGRTVGGPATTPAVREVVIEELVKVSGRQRPSMSTPLSELGLDSVKVAMLATAVEDRLGVQVPLSLAWEVEDVASFVDAVGATVRAGSVEQRTGGRRDEPGPVVIVGAACRFPGGVTSPRRYQELITAGAAGTGITPGAVRTGRRPAGLVPELTEFAPARFGIGDDEARSMDPRQRLALTLAWEALQDAGRDPRTVRGSRIGVYLGASDGEHLRLDDPALAGVAPGYRTTGAAGALLANRISYVLGLRGPSMVVDTACSASLVAVDLALKALRSGAIDGALVGGVSALLDGRVTELLADAGMLSARGVCSTFDDAADGYVRGEGGAVLYLERPGTGAVDGPSPYCAILGSAVNQDGRSNGLTAPNGTAQQDVVREALADAGRSPADIGYVEAHGTATPLGDPVEVSSLRRVLDGTPGGSPVWLGSAKAQLGHLEAAAGVAGLLRAALIVRDGVVPSQAEFVEPSGRIDWAGSRLRVPVHASGWDAPRRTAGVSSFGFGGTNSHVVIESVPPVPRGEPGRFEGPVLLRLAGESPQDLRRQAVELRDVGAGQGSVRALAGALERSRAGARFRSWTVATESDGAGEALERLGAAAVCELAADGPVLRAPSVALLAAGHGAPVVGALAGIYGNDPVVTAVLDELGGPSSLPLRVLVEDDARSREAVARTAVAQPVHFALAVCLGERLRAWGLEPSVVAGHSVGALAAACLAGAFERRRGYELITRRGELMEATPVGGMLAVQAGLDEAQEIASVCDLDVAVVNASGSIVLSGALDGIVRAETEAGRRGRRSTRLPVTRAFHSRQMRSVASELAAAVTAAMPRQVSTTFVSDVDGRSDTDLTAPDYWVGHAVEPIDFRSAAQVLAAHDVVVELGPSYLLPLIRANAGSSMPAALPAFGDGRGMAALLEGAGRLWDVGVGLADVAGAKGPVPRLPVTRVVSHRYPLPGDPGATTPVDEAPIRRDDHPRDDNPRADHPRDVDGWVDLLRERLGGRLGIPTSRVPVDAGLFDLGLTSVVANELREELGRSLGRSLSSTVVFDHPTVRHLASHLDDLARDDVTTARPGALGRTHDEPGGPPAGGRRRVSVVGMALRLPGADDPAAYWKLILDGGSLMAEPPEGRWPDADEVLGDGERAWSSRGGFLTADPAVFDAGRFGISPREARSMDPQHRVLLETVERALDDAGLSREELRGTRAGVWVGMSSADYASLRPRTDHDSADPYAVTGNSPALASGRIAHHLGVTGPAVTIDTACSSSLVACDEALRALRAGTIDLAVVGGVNLMLAARTSAALADMGALSAAGRCASFGADADGYARGEGCGVVVLRRSDDAVRRGERPWFDLLGGAVNHDGVSAGLTVPNGAAQEGLIRAAHQDAGVVAHEIDYVEAHGTGTPLGDPIELAALAGVFDDGRDRSLPIGSVKAQIGHLEAAAGIAALIKAGLVAGQGVVPPHAPDLEPTARFDWSSSRLELSWAAGRQASRPLVCGVSSFGFSGTNGHVVVSGPTRRRLAEVAPDVLSTGGPHVVRLSHGSAEGLQEDRRRLVEALRRNAVDLAEAAAVPPGTQVGDTYRLAVVAQDADEAIRVLDCADDPTVDPGRADLHLGDPARSRRATWLFSGVGTQWKGMVGHLGTDRTGRLHLERADDALRSMGNPALGDGRWSAVGRQEHLQPAITAVQVALGASLRQLGGHRDAVVGYSAGVIGALVEVGHIDLDDALRLAAWRGRVLDAAAGSGASAACGLGAGAVREVCAREGLDDLVVASATGPANSTVSGAVHELAVLEGVCRTAGTWWAPVSDGLPLHHPRLEGLVASDLAPPEVTWSSGDGTELLLVGGATVDELMADTSRFLDEIWQPLDLSAASTTLAGSGRSGIVVEVAPQPALASAMSGWHDDRDVQVVPLMVPGRDASRQLRRGAAALWAGAGGGRGADPSAGGSADVGSPERHWWADPDIGSRPPVRRDEAFYRLRWTVANESPRRVASRPDSWLVLTGEPSDVGASIAGAIVGRGHEVEVRTFAEAVDVAGRSGARRGVVLDATRAPDPAVDPSWYERFLALLTPLDGPDTEVWVVTRGATTAGGDSDLGPAAVWGLARALSAEHPQWWGGAVDLSTDQSWTEALTQRLVDEMLDGGVDDQVALRGGARMVPRLATTDLAPARTLELDANAAYLVTGGSGTLGRRMLRWLVDRGARHVVLVARSAAETQQTRLGDLRGELEAHGVSLHFVRADVADQGQLKGVFEAEPAPWPTIRGVLHLAGHMSSGPFSSVTAAELTESWRPKAGGALALEEISREHPLDFVVLFSSASSVWGSAMAGAYVCANYALDVIAERARRDGLPFTSANWSWWPDTAMADGVHEYFSRMGLGPVGDDVGWAVMDELVDQERTGLVVAPVDWSSFLPVMSARRPRPIFDRLARPVTDPDGAHRAGPTDGVAWTSEEIEVRLDAGLRKVLGTDGPIDPHRGFFDMGVDSIMSLELKRDIESWSGRRLDDAFLFEHPRLADLTAALVSAWGTDVPGGPTVAAAPDRAPSVPGPRPDAEIDSLGTHELLSLLVSELDSVKGPEHD